MSSSSRNLLTTNGVIVLTLGVGFVNNIVIAAVFGLTRSVDAFYAAQMLPNLFMVLCIDYLGKNFLPTLARAKKQSEQLASELTSSIVTNVSIFTLVMAIALAFSSAFLFEVLLPGFSAEDIELVTRYFWIMAPALVLMAATVFHQHVCQYSDDYVRIVTIQAALPVANLVSLLVASPLIGTYALPVGYLLGHCVVFGLMAWRAKYRYRWRTAVRREWEGKVFSNSAIVIGSGLVARTKMVILNYLGSQLGSGAIAALAFSARLTEPLGRTIFTGVRMLMFSRTARLAVDGRSSEIARLHQIGIQASFLLLTPLLWWIGLNADIIVGTLFLRGEFDLRMATMVSLALIGALPSVIFGVNALLSNAFYAMDRIAVPALVMPLGTLILLGISPVLSARYGVLGLTLGTSISMAAVFLLLVGLLSRRVSEFCAMGTIWALARYSFISALAFGALALTLSHYGFSQLLSASLSLPAGLLMYVLVLLALRDHTLEFLYRFVRRALPARGSVSQSGS
jgi:putative peptidoglycan lipid II flippase